MTTQAQPVAGRRAVDARDIPLVWLWPRRVFARVEDVRSWRWPLLILLAAVTLLGYATVQTGLIDLEVDREVGTRLAEVDRAKRDVVERSALRELYQQEHKLGEFNKLLTRLRVVLAAPAQTLGSLLLVAVALYGAVALSGRKPEWHTLLTICVLAEFIDWLRQVVTLGLMLKFATLEVDTSPALLARLLAGTATAKPVIAAALSASLTALDPFRLWYWGVVIQGVSVTTQLPGWRAWLVCTLCWLGGTGVRCGLAILLAHLATRAAGGP